MIAFEIFLNENKICTAGIGDHGVLSATISWARTRKIRAPVDFINKSVSRPSYLHIGGLMSGDQKPNEYLDWVVLKDVSVGDRIRLKIVNAEAVDEPAKRVADTPERREESNRFLYETYKTEFDGSTELVDNIAQEKEMTCFQININGAPICTAGVGEFGVLSSILTWVSNKEDESPDLGGTTFTVVGLTSQGGDGANEYIYWVRESLKAGDEVMIQVLSCTEPDAPKYRTPQDPDEDAKNQESRRAGYEQLKKKYEENGG